MLDTFISTVDGWSDNLNISG